MLLRRVLDEWHTVWQQDGFGTLKVQIIANRLGQHAGTAGVKHNLKKSSFRITSMFSCGPALAPTYSCHLSLSHLLFLGWSKTSLTSWCQIFFDSTGTVVQEDQERVLLKQIAICLISVSGGCWFLFVCFLFWLVLGSREMSMVKLCFHLLCPCKSFFVKLVVMNPSWVPSDRAGLQPGGRFSRDFSLLEGLHKSASVLTREHEDLTYIITAHQQSWNPYCFPRCPLKIR